jgi:RNA-directed DNA polymerase
MFSYGIGIAAIYAEAGREAEFLDCSYGFRPGKSAHDALEERREGNGGKPTVSRPTQGTPQGGVISPLMATLYLHCFDKRLHCRTGPAAWAKARLIRNADDYVVMARYVGEQIVNWSEEVVEVRMREIRMSGLMRERARAAHASRPSLHYRLRGYHESGIAK